MTNKTVKMCSIGKRKIGVFLSGGLDSTVVAYELNKIQPPAQTFTNMMVPLPSADEDFNSDHNCAKELEDNEEFRTNIPWQYYPDYKTISKCIYNDNGDCIDIN